MWCYTGVRHSTDTKEMQEIVWEFMPVFSNLLKALSFLLQCVIAVCSERSNARAHTHTIHGWTLGADKAGVLVKTGSRACVPFVSLNSL